jgi:hypothetical protein
VGSWDTANWRQPVALVTVAVLLGVGLSLGNGWVVWHVTGVIYDLTGVELLYGDGVLRHHLNSAITWPHWHVTLDYGWTYLSLLPLVLFVVVAYSLVNAWVPGTRSRRAIFWKVWLACIGAAVAVGVGQLLWSILLDYFDWPIWWKLFGSFGHLMFVAEGIDWTALWLIVYSAEWGAFAGGLAAAVAARSR